jgi:hypothetical protein
MQTKGWRWALILGTFSLSGCVHTKNTYLADGNRGYSVTCSGIMSSWSGCLVKAGRMCGKRGYLIRYSDEVDREMLVECKVPGQ